ncbi:MAG: NADPH:quinone oxidoreductase [Herbaspirillum sp.]|jgi:chromate reductase|nr:NADPH:quinone oxidoreductase [Herbaspirillum sp.]
MSTTKRIAVLVGSLRQGSFNRKLALQLKAIAPAGLQLDIVEIGDLPLFNQDMEATPPAPWVAFREAISKVDGLLFVTPEYNRSMPAALKNAIDVGSRPYGQSVWNGKPGGVISVSPGAVGAFGANHHLRQSLVFLNVPALQQPEAYIGHAEKIFAEDGSLVPSTREFMEKYLQAFQRWVETIAVSG